jgi:FkbM family methyltransferase
MASKHWSIFKTRYKQIGAWRSLAFALLKALRRLLSPGVQFHFGGNAEDIVLQWLVLNYLGNTTPSYIDVGCHEPRRISNSYLMYLGGSRGLAIDLNPSFVDMFKRERPNDIFVCAAVSSSPTEAIVHEFTAAEVATIDVAQAEIWRDRFRHKHAREVRTETLADLVRAHAPSVHFDVLLLDVEGHELEVLRGADLPTLRPAIVACEMHELDLAAAMLHPVVQLLAVQGYRLVAFAAASGYFVRRDLLVGKA